jgi:peptidoglycan/LPS O-acetylase OafA/YrhL
VKPLASTNDRLDVLDGLRGVAILLVVWYHLWLVSGYAGPLAVVARTIAQSGFLGVDVFFFLSGWCIAMPYARARSANRPAPSVSDFAWRRALKIVPSYALALAIFALAFHDRFDGPFEEAIHLAAHAAFVHVFFPPTFGSLSGPLWTLGVEVQFYVLFALVAPFVMRRPFAAYASLVAVSVVYRGLIAAFGLDTDFGWVNQLPAVLDVFGAGVLAAFVFTRAKRDARGAHPALGGVAAAAGVLFAAIALYGVVAASSAGGDDAVHRWLNAWRIAFGPVLCLATLGIALGSVRLRAAVAFEPLRALAAISYGAYLFNLEIVVAVARFGLPAPAVFWIGALGTIVVAALVTYGFERPIQRYGEARLRAARVAGGFPRLFSPVQSTLTERSGAA